MHMIHPLERGKNSLSHEVAPTQPGACSVLSSVEYEFLYSLHGAVQNPQAEVVAAFGKKRFVRLAHTLADPMQKQAFS